MPECFFICILNQTGGIFRFQTVTGTGVKLSVSGHHIDVRDLAVEIKPVVIPQVNAPLVAVVLIFASLLLPLRRPLKLYLFSFKNGGALYKCLQHKVTDHPGLSG